MVPRDNGLAPRPGEAPSEAGAPASRQRRRKRLPRWFGLIQLGLGFHAARVLFDLFAVLGTLGLVCYAAVAQDGFSHDAARVGVWVVYGAVAAACALALVGSGLCLLGGAAAQAWWPLFASAALQALTPPVFVCLHLASLPKGFGLLPPLAAWVLFMLFLRQLACGLNRRDLADEALALLTRGLALLVAAPLLLVLLAQVAVLLAFTHSGQGLATLLVVVCGGVLVTQAVFLVHLSFSLLAYFGTIREVICARLEKKERTADSPQGETASGPDGAHEALGSTAPAPPADGAGALPLSSNPVKACPECGEPLRVFEDGSSEPCALCDRAGSPRETSAEGGRKRRRKKRPDEVTEEYTPNRPRRGASSMLPLALVVFAACAWAALASLPWTSPGGKRGLLLIACGALTLMVAIPWALWQAREDGLEPIGFPVGVGGALNVLHFVMMMVSTPVVIVWHLLSNPTVAAPPALVFFIGVGMITTGLFLPQ